MTILLTGATGLVGPRLLQRLTAVGIPCRALVRQGKEVPEGVECAEGDILQPASLPAAVEGATAVIHLAAVFRTRDDELIWSVNRDGTRNLIDAVTEHAPQARFLLASTSNVYDDDAPHPGREDDTVSPTLAYPASKIAAEAMLKDSALTWAVLRLPFIYGDQDGHLDTLPELAEKMGWHPAQRLSVIHHADIATAFTLALDGAFDGRTVNIADSAPMSIHDMAQIVGYPYPSSAEPLSQPWKGVMDVTAARQLGFTPTIPTLHDAAGHNLL